MCLLKFFTNAGQLELITNNSRIEIGVHSSIAVFGYRKENTASLQWWVSLSNLFQKDHSISII